MKTEDLQIGDWVLYKSDKPENTFPIQVTLDIMYNEIQKWEDRFEYIPLTPGILKKNGFSESTHTGVWFSTELPCSIDIERKLKYKNDKVEELSNEIEISINYVHKLKYFFNGL